MFCAWTSRFLGLSFENYFSSLLQSLPWPKAFPRVLYATQRTSGPISIAVEENSSYYLKSIRDSICLVAIKESGLSTLALSPRYPDLQSVKDRALRTHSHFSPFKACPSLLNISTPSHMVPQSGWYRSRTRSSKHHCRHTHRPYWLGKLPWRSLQSCRGKFHSSLCSAYLVSR